MVVFSIGDTCIYGHFVARYALGQGRILWLAKIHVNIIFRELVEFSVTVEYHVGEFIIYIMYMFK